MKIALILTSIVLMFGGVGALDSGTESLGTLVVFGVAVLTGLIAMKVE